jgi:hypothetical protein
MLIYLGGCASTRHAEFLVENDANVLMSFAYKSNAKKYLEVLAESGKMANIILDSGAFTSWTKGKPVDIHELIQWYSGIIDTYSAYCKSIYLINLDVIPGNAGRDPSMAEIEESMKQSAKNFDTLFSCFPEIVIPVFHQGEPESYLEDLCYMTDYVAISPRNDVAENFRLTWCQAHQCCAKKIHGLATTGWKNMSTVGYYSIDSAAWAIRAGMGKIFYPTKGMLKDIFVTDDSPYMAVANRHLCNIPESERRWLINLMTEGGFGVEKICSDYLTRSLWNAKVFINLKVEKTLVQPLSLF